MSETNYAIKITDETDDTFTIGGYGVVFGGVDIQGETFTDETDYWLDRVPVKAVFYDHSQGQKMPAVVGETVKEEQDEIGIWVETQLQRASAYAQAVRELIKKGVPLGYSSGAVSHLARVEEGTIKSWPIFEYSITPTPAEPRTVGLERVKQLADTYTDLKTLLESDQEIANADVTDGDGEAKEIIKETKKMTEEIKDSPAAVDYEKIGAAMTKAVEPLEERLKALEEREVNVPDVALKVVEDEADKKLEGDPFKSFGEFLQVVATNQGDDRLKPVQSQGVGLKGRYFDVTKAMGPEFVGSMRDAAIKAPTGLQEGIPSAGGFLVGQDRAPGLLSRVYDVGSLIQRTDMVGLGENSNGMTFYAEDETSRATGSRRGGIRFYWAAEAEEKTASKPKFREMELKLKKAIGLVYATDELLADASALNDWIMKNLPEELAFGVEDSVVNGTGVGMPLGILNSGALVSVAKETGQAAATIVAENISKMWARRWIRGRNYVWLYNQDVEPELDNLNLAVGTGGSLVYMPPGGLSDAPYGRIKGRPAIPVEYAATLGTVGDLMLVDLGEYQMIDKGGVESAASIHVRFVYDETVFRFVYRIDGQPKWDAPLTPFKGTNTVSPFVALATRA